MAVDADDEIFRRVLPKVRADLPGESDEELMSFMKTQYFRELYPDLNVMLNSTIVSSAEVDIESETVNNVTAEEIGTTSSSITMPNDSSIEIEILPTPEKSKIEVLILTSDTESGMTEPHYEVALTSCEKVKTADESRTKDEKLARIEKKLVHKDAKKERRGEVDGFEETIAKQKGGKRRRLVSSSSSSSSSFYASGNMDGTIKSSEKKIRKKPKLIKTSDSDSLLSVRSKRVNFLSSSKHKNKKPKKDHKKTKTKERKHNRDRRNSSEEVERSFLRELKKSTARKKKSTTTPFSAYLKSRSMLIRGQPWTPHTDTDFYNLKKNYNLKMLTVPCVDLLNMKTFFHSPDLYGLPMCLTSQPLKKRLIVSKEKAEMILKMEKLKVGPFKRKLDRLYLLTKQRTSKQLKPKHETRKTAMTTNNSEQMTKRLTTFDFLKAEKDSETKLKSTKRSKEKSKTELELDCKKKSDRTSKMGLASKLKSESSDTKNTFTDLNSKCSSPAGRFKSSDSKTLENAAQVPFQDTAKTKMNTNRQEQPIRPPTPRPWTPPPVNQASNRRCVFLNSHLPIGKSKPIVQAVRPNVKVGKPQRPQPKKKNLKQRKSKFEPVLSPAMSSKVAQIQESIDKLQKIEASKPVVALIYPPSFNVPTPSVNVLEIGKGTMASKVLKELSKNTELELPIMPDDSESELYEYTTKKIAWWFLKTDSDPADTVLVHPELHDNEQLEGNYADDHSSDSSSIGCGVSDTEDVPIFFDGSTRNFDDPNRLDEYCGLASLNAKHRRINSAVDLDASKDLIANFDKFVVRRLQTNYESENFEVRCHLCNEEMKGQRQYGAHIRSNRHKNNFRNCSLKMAWYEESSMKSSPTNNFVAKLMVYDNCSATHLEQLVASLDKPILKLPQNPLGDIDFTNQDRKKPGIQDNQASEASEVSLPDIELFRLGKDYQQQEAKLALRLERKWNSKLESNWVKMLKEEERLIKEYDKQRVEFVNTPSQHPDHDQRWLSFWQRRCSEIEAEGKDPEQFDFGKEWVPFWFREMQEILKIAAEKRITDMKVGFGMDAKHLKWLKDQPSNGFQQQSHNVPGVISSSGRPHNYNSNNRGRGNRSRPYNHPNRGNGHHRGNYNQTYNFQSNNFRGSNNNRSFRANNNIYNRGNR